VEGRRAFGDPCEEGIEARVSTEFFRRVEVAGKFGFGESGVDFIVADLVKKHCGSVFASAQFGREVVLTLLGVRRDRAVAEWADGMAHV